MIRFIVPLLLLAAACHDAKPVAIHGATMGTRYSIMVTALPPSFTLTSLKARIDEALEKLNDQMSTYRPDSEVSRFNRSSGGDWFPVAPDTVRVVRQALETSRATGGAFDITVGPLVNLWGFGPRKKERTVPAERAIRETLQQIGYRYLETRDSPPSLKKKIDAIQVDLSAIAKGYGVDLVSTLLLELGTTGFLVEIGGEIRTHGVKADGSPWRLGIEKPLAGETEVIERLKVTDAALATSGDYRNFFTHEGKRLSHTIDPRTGRPVEHALGSVTVVAGTCMEADAWATALMVLGPQEGFDKACEENLAAFFIVRTEDGFQTNATPVFQAMLR
jgi:thiamine biosynthesis lipoprotein